MVDFIRKQLNELMGEDVDDDDDGSVSDFTAQQHCRYYLCGLCPFDVLVKTNYSIGACPYTHSLPARHAYEEVSKKVDHGYEALLARKLRSIVRECERRIDTNQRRVEDNEREKVRANPHEEELAELSTVYDRLLENGELDEANTIQTKIEELKAKRAAVTAAAGATEFAADGSAVVGQVIASLGSHPQFQNLRVCDICGLLLSSKEATKLDDHFIGKLHTGFGLIRDKLEEVDLILSIDNGTYLKPQQPEPSATKAETTETNGEPSLPVSVPETSSGEIQAASNDETAHAPSNSEGEKESNAIGESKKVEENEIKTSASLNPSSDEKEAPIAEVPIPKARTRVTTGYETELPLPPRKGDHDRYQRDRDRPRYGDERDRDYDRDRDASRYNNKDRYRRREYNDRPRSNRDGGRHYRDRDGPRDYHDQDDGHRRDSYRGRY